MAVPALPRYVLFRGGESTQALSTLPCSTCGFFLRTLRVVSYRIVSPHICKDPHPTHSVRHDDQIGIAVFSKHRRPPRDLSNKPLPSPHIRDISWQRLLSPSSSALTPSAVREVKTLPITPPGTYVNPRPGLREGAVARCTTVQRTTRRSLECVGQVHCIPSPFILVDLGAQLSAFLALIIALLSRDIYTDLALAAAVTDIQIFVYALPSSRCDRAVAFHDHPSVEAATRHLSNMATTSHRVDADRCTVYSSRIKNGVTPPLMRNAMLWLTD
jgi:hypothetical protein